MYRIIYDERYKTYRVEEERRLPILGTYWRRVEKSCMGGSFEAHFGSEAEAEEHIKERKMFALGRERVVKIIA